MLGFIILSDCLCFLDKIYLGLRLDRNMPLYGLSNSIKIHPKNDSNEFLFHDNFRIGFLMILNPFGGAKSGPSWGHVGVIFGQNGRSSLIRRSLLCDLGSLGRLFRKNQHFYPPRPPFRYHFGWFGRVIWGNMASKIYKNRFNINAMTPSLVDFICSYNL